LYLARFARSVTVLVRGASLAETMSQYLVERIDEAENIEVRTRVAVSEVHGDRSLEAVSVRDLGTGAVERLAARAVFVYIGAAPRTAWLGGAVQCDAAGFVLSGVDLQLEGGKRPHGWLAERDPFWLETSIAGVFVAGDLRHQSTKRVASAVGEGAMAVQFVHQHLRGPAPAQRPLPPAGS
jgi:thioredoxin reductase (NADPH)